MSTIHKISERAPEFPCWLWESCNHFWILWHAKNALPAQYLLVSGYTHWCHSDTEPSATPEAVGQVKEPPAPAPSREPIAIELQEAFDNIALQAARDAQPYQRFPENVAIGLVAARILVAIDEARAAMKGTTP